ncbi:uncharacterized protein LOC135812108 isoform X2 [Sycon ciliatum]|uniref:uncharacterized protein LOC135812108 isoform X2 n=1 Tax=Sycon ciliatum TaxID=27933 RepID=UPI0031F68A7A
MRPGLLHILLGCVLFLLDPGSALGLFDSLDSAGAAAPTDSFRFAFPTSSPTRGLAEGATSTSEPSSYYTSSSYGTRPPITANSTGHPASPASKESPLSSVATTSSTVSTELASSPASSHAQNQSTVSSTQLRETVTSTNGEPTPATVMSRSTTAIVATAKRRKARRRKNSCGSGDKSRPAYYGSASMSRSRAHTAAVPRASSGAVVWNFQQRLRGLLPLCCTAITLEGHCPGARVAIDPCQCA